MKSGNLMVGTLIDGNLIASAVGGCCGREAASDTPHRIAAVRAGAPGAARAAGDILNLTGGDNDDDGSEITLFRPDDRGFEWFQKCSEGREESYDIGGKTGFWTKADEVHANWQELYEASCEWSVWRRFFMRPMAGANQLYRVSTTRVRASLCGHARC